MCMHWLKYVRLNRKDRLKNMRAMTLEVAMLADVSGAFSMYLTLIGQKTLMAWPLNFDDLFWITS